MKAFFEMVWAFIVKYWVSLVLLAIGIAQMFFSHWLILLAMALVAVGIGLVAYFKK